MPDLHPPASIFRHPLPSAFSVVNGKKEKGKKEKTGVLRFFDTLLSVIIHFLRVLRGFVVNSILHSPDPSAFSVSSVVNGKKEKGKKEKTGVLRFFDTLLSVIIHFLRDLRGFVVNSILHSPDPSVYSVPSVVKKHLSFEPLCGVCGE